MKAEDLRPGIRVRVDGEHGTFKVLDPPTSPDGSARLFGGDRDPNGRQFHRSVMPDRLSVDTRKSMRKGN